MGQTAKGLFWKTEKQSHKAIRVKQGELDERWIQLLSWNWFIIY